MFKNNVIQNTWWTLFLTVTMDLSSSSKYDFIYTVCYKHRIQIYYDI